MYYGIKGGTQICTYMVFTMGLREVHRYVHTIYVLSDKRRYTDMYIYCMYYGIKGGTQICTYVYGMYNGIKGGTQICTYMVCTMG